MTDPRPVDIDGDPNENADVICITPEDAVEGFDRNAPHYDDEEDDDA